jgi:hypothetical protein
MSISIDGWTLIKKMLIRDNDPNVDLGEIAIDNPQPCVIKQAFPQVQQSLPFPPISGSILVSGVMPISNPLFDGYYDKEQLRKRNSDMGNRVLRNIEAQETERIGELATTIHDRLSTLKAQMSLTNSQWQLFAELSSSINDLIGDPYDPESSDAD